MEDSEMSHKNLNQRVTFVGSSRFLTIMAQGEDP